MKNIRKLLFFLLSILIAVSGISQEKLGECYEISNPYIKKIYAEAQNQLKFGTAAAYSKMLKAVKIQPLFAEGYYLLGEIDYQKGRSYRNSNNPHYNPELYFNNAVKFFSKVIELCPKLENYSAYYYLGEYYFEKENYSKSKEYLDIFVSNSISNYELLKNAEELLKGIAKYYDLLNNPVTFTPENVQKISTSADEFLPLLSPDESLFFFTRRKILKKNNRKTESLEQLVFSKKIENDTAFLYTEGEPMPYPFNQNFEQGGMSVTINNKELYLTVCKPQRTKYSSYKNCDIYYTRKNKGKWIHLEKLGRNINNPQSWEAQPSITADGKVLFFASTRKGGYGGVDIYRSVKDSLGNWGKAENLGADINTSKDDKTPFLHIDGKTLYFSSNGRIGMGGFDIFCSQYIGAGRWSEPQNIGYPINTKDDELAFSVRANGEDFFFASKKLEGKGGWDIYTAKMPKQTKPEKVVFLKGKLYDEKGNTLQNATVELQSIKTLRLIKGIIDPESGDYSVASSIIDNEDFIITVKKQGYFFNSEYIRPNKKLHGKPNRLDFELHPIEVGTKIRLKNIYFETNSATFDEISIISLNNFVEFLNVNPNLKIEIYGHTDEVGTNESNLDLSNRRAKAVFDYIVEHGINSHRATYKGFGETKPIASNATPKGRALNRRTEFVVIVK